MKHPHRLILATFLLAMLAACDPADRVSDKDIEPIDYPQLVKLLDQPDARVVLVDVRRPADYAKGHLPGAINIFLPDLRSGDRRLNAAKSIVVYASGEGQDPLAPAATKMLIAKGYKGVVEFQGGLLKWKAEGGPVVSPATAE